MGIQDDIFDVEEKLKELGDETLIESFVNIYKWAFDMDEDIDKLRVENENLKTAIVVLRKMI